MKEVLLVGIGGFIGSAARYQLGAAILHMMGQGRFPYGTFVINVVGCGIIGVLAGLAEQHGFFRPAARLFLFTGLLGGFTTFSAFGLETMFLLRRGELWSAAAYAGSSVVVGITAVWLGLKLVSMLPR
ncbi:MAG: fluoride efflux transporter CrcB [Verrucomicrobiota bacterium]